MMLSKNLAVAVLAVVALASCGQSDQKAAEPAAPAEIQTPVAAAPANVGDCVETTVSLVGPRLENVPGSGSAIEYANGLAQVSYDAVPGIDHSQVGDAVRLCLTSVPENCPPGDERGKVYSATNARTSETWSAPDSQHSCGGA